jgi:hypothetical protein
MLLFAAIAFALFAYLSARGVIALKYEENGGGGTWLLVPVGGIGALASLVYGATLLPALAVGVVAAIAAAVLSFVVFVSGFFAMSGEIDRHPRAKLLAPIGLIGIAASLAWLAWLIFS